MPNFLMNKKAELALLLIRAPWFVRLADRSFILCLAAGIIGVWLFAQSALTGEGLAQFLGATWGVWILANTGKDTVIGKSAIDGTPATETDKGDVQ